jgi:hypothetical protein
VVNEDPTEKLIADLKAENEKLKKMLASGKVDPALMASLSGGSAAAGAPAADGTLISFLLNKIHSLGFDF